MSVMDVRARPAKAPHVEAPALLDQEAVASLVELGGPELLRELVDDYDAQARAACVALREAMAGRDGAGMARTAHVLKASSLTLGCRAAASSFAEVERLGRAGAIEQARPIVERLPGELARALASLRAFGG